jgi:multidrug efflux pump subunit AcrA (membrane-fusion protein)
MMPRKPASRSRSHSSIRTGRQALQQRIVRSPIDGVVTERVMSPGEFRSNEASHILTIAS